MLPCYHVTMSPCYHVTMLPHLTRTCKAGLLGMWVKGCGRDHGSHPRVTSTTWVRVRGPRVTSTGHIHGSHPRVTSTTWQGWMRHRQHEQHALPNKTWHSHTRSCKAIRHYIGDQHHIGHCIQHHILSYHQIIATIVP